MKSFTNRDAKKVEYEYNGVGDVWKMWSPNHATPFTYAYNANNQVTSVTNPNGYTITFAYDGGGRRTRMYRPGSEHQYGYDARNHLRYATTWKNGGGHIYRSYYYPHSWDQTLWDHTGNPLLKNEYFPDSQYAYNTHLRYDALYRLIRERVCDPYGQVVFDVTYTYDQVGNRLSETRDGVTTTYTYDDNDRLTSMTRGGQSATFGYDGEGNLLSVSGSLFGSWTLSQSDENRLQWVTYPSGGGSETDLYWTSALGQVYRSRLQGSYYRYIYDGNRVLEQTDDSGGTVVRYTPESGSYYAPLLHLRRSDGTSRWPSYDGVGTIRALSDDTGTRTDAYDLDAFGRDLGGTGTTPNPYRFGGAWGYVTEPSGLLHLGQRFYWPEIGRFIEKDPSRDGTNWYAYVANNPLVFIDPDGLDLTIPGLSGQPFLVFDEGSGEQLGMSAGATLSGLAAGATFGLWQPDWTDSCDPYAGFSRGMGTMSGVALSMAAGLGGAKAAGAKGADPWLGTVAKHGAHHGRGPHIQVIVRTGKKASRTIARRKWPPWRKGP